MEESDNQYNFAHSRRGVAVIIVNEKCMGHSEGRLGCAKDRDMLQDMFCQLGFEIRTFWDLGAKDLLSQLLRISREDLSDTDCLALAISTHGSEIQTADKVREDTVFTRDGEIKTKLLLEMFTDKKCPSLKGKPRLVFIQACRGYNLDSGQEVHYTRTASNGSDESNSEEDSRDARPFSGLSCVRSKSPNSGTSAFVEQPKTFGNLPYRTVAPTEPTMQHLVPLRDVVIQPAPCYKDFLVMYSTPPGFYAFRRGSQGSWFIKYLTQVLKSQDGPASLTRRLTRVVAMVTKDMSHSSKRPAYSNKKQTPVIYSMLTKDIILRPQVEG